MNQTQVNSFLQCLSHIDDENYIGLRTAGSADGVERAADTSDDSSQSHDILVAKIVALVVLFCATSFCGSIPFMLNRCFKWTDTNTNARTTTVVKCLLYFGGGVLLCTTFLHMLPEVEETVEQLQECGELPELYFSLSEMLMCGGFLLMFLIEELIHAFIHHKQKQRTSEQDKAREAFERGRSVRNSYLVKGKPTAPLDAAAPQLKQAPEVAVESAAGHSKATGMGLSAQDLIANDVDQQNYMQSQYSDNRESLDHHHMHHHHHHDHDHDHIHQHQHHHHHHDHAHGHGHSHMAAMGGDDETPDPVRSWLRGLLIVVALSLHEVFEGLAIGLETSSASAVWLMFGAVSAHKLVLAFCVSVELIVARTRPLLSVVYVITFAIVSPIGIAIGILVSHNEDTTASSIPSAILQGLACGTLLYVVFFEILSKNRAGLLAFLSLFVGFALMFGMQSLGGDDDHDHSCSSSSTASTTASPADNSDIVRSSLGGFHDVHHGGHGHAGHSHHPPTVAHLEQQLKVLRDASRKLIGSMKNQTEAM